MRRVAITAIAIDTTTVASTLWSDIFLRQRRPVFCALCKLQRFCCKKDAIGSMCVKEFLERNSENKAKLNELAEVIWPF